MDIVVRGEDSITQWDVIKNLKQNEAHWVWRSSNKPDSGPGDKVYFYKDGYIVGFCYYGGYEYKLAQREDGQLQSGMAILIKGPYCERQQPIGINLKGTWRWRYVDRAKGLRELLDSQRELPP